MSSPYIILGGLNSNTRMFLYTKKHKLTDKIPVSFSFNWGMNYSFLYTNHSVLLIYFFSSLTYKLF